MKYKVGEIYINLNHGMMWKLLKIRTGLRGEIYDYLTLANMLDPDEKDRKSSFEQGSSMSQGNFPWMAGYLRHTFVRRIWPTQLGNI